MTGPEHYQQAEALLEEASDPADHGVSAVHAHIARAQAHATLALAAATALHVTAGELTETDCEDWSLAIGGPKL